jgi:transposase
MLSVTSATRVLVATTPVDLRGSFNRLYGLVVEQLKADPLSGHLFVFTNSRQHQTTFNIPIR